VREHQAQQGVELNRTAMMHVQAVCKVTAAVLRQQSSQETKTRQSYML
jgi:hypothetical protein